MKLVFKKPGKYKNGTRVTVVSEDAVEKKSVFEVEAKNAVVFIRVGKAVAFDSEPEPEDIVEEKLEDLKVEELLELAKKEEVDIGDAKKKAEIIEAIEQARKANAEK